MFKVVRLLYILLQVALLIGVQGISMLIRCLSMPTALIILLVPKMII